MRMTWQEFEDKYGETRADHADHPECPHCGSRRVTVIRYLDGQDADGNRGRMVEEIECDECDG